MLEKCIYWALLVWEVRIAWIKKMLWPWLPALEAVCGSEPVLVLQNGGAGWKDVAEELRAAMCSLPGSLSTQQLLVVLWFPTKCTLSAGSTSPICRCVGWAQPPWAASLQGAVPPPVHVCVRLLLGLWTHTQSMSVSGEHHLLLAARMCCSSLSTSPKSVSSEHVVTYNVWYSQWLLHLFFLISGAVG